jgi:hypothetical protein
LEWLGKKSADSVNFFLVVNPPMELSLLTPWIYVAWILHVPILAFCIRPRWITRLCVGFLSAHWTAFATVISFSSWYPLPLKVLMWGFWSFMVLAYFRVELGDDI